MLGFKLNQLNVPLSINKKTGLRLKSNDDSLSLSAHETQPFKTPCFNRAKDQLYLHLTHELRLKYGDNKEPNVQHGQTPWPPALTKSKLYEQ